jgi:hypothetical protein
VHGHADRENQKESADELDDVFFHNEVDAVEMEGSRAGGNAGLRA